MDTLPEMISYYNAQTRISIMVPAEWTGQIVNETQFRLFSRAAPQFDDYRSSISYQINKAQQHTEAWFDTLVAYAGKSISDYNDFKELREERFALNSPSLAHARWFEWRDADTGMFFSQLQAFILEQAGSLYIINAATLKPLENRYIPIFNAILHSTRILPGPDAPQPPPAPTATTESIFDTLVRFFQTEGWPFTPMEDQPVLQMQFEGQNHTYFCYAQAKEAERQCVFYAVCPVNAPANKRQAVAEFLTRVNYGLAIGNLELDFDDGEIRYKTSLDVEGDRLSLALLRQLVYANLVTLDLYFPGILSVIYGNLTPAEALAQIEASL